MSAIQSNPIKKVLQQKQRREARQKGQPYTTSKGKNIPQRKPPHAEATCSCKYSCKELSNEQKQLLFLEFYKIDEQSQGTYLLNHIQMLPIIRRRHGRYESPEDSRRTCTFAYNVPNGSGKNVQVCSNTFKGIFSVSARKLQTLQCKKKQCSLVYEDTRGSNPESHKHNFKFTENDRNLVRCHINSFPRYESHYCRKRSSNVFLSPDLNKQRLFLCFKENYPTSPVNYSYYAVIIKKDFPQLKFKALATDTCKKCDLFKVKLQSTASERDKKEIKVQQELHHRKAEKAQECMKQDV